MIEFKTWRDSYIFLKDYATCSCLNCVHTKADLDLSVDHSDSEYARHFCTHHIAMVNLSFMTVCQNWEDENGNTIASKGDEKVWKLSEEEMNLLLAEDGKLWGIDEIKEFLGR